MRLSKHQKEIIAACLMSSAGAIVYLISPVLVGSAIDLVVAMQRGPEGQRVSGILEIQGHEGGDVSYQSVPF